jgi:hypothetical protein
MDDLREARGCSDDGGAQRVKVASNVAGVASARLRLKPIADERRPVLGLRAGSRHATDLV